MTTSGPHDKRNHAEVVPALDATPTVEGLLSKLVAAPRRSLAVLLIAALLGTIGFFLVTPRYAARTDVVVVASSGPVVSSSGRDDVSIDSSLQLLASDGVLGATARELNYPRRSSGLWSDLTISPLLNSRILRLTVSNESATLGRDSAQLLAQNFLTARTRLLERAAKTRATDVEGQIESIDQSLQTGTPDARSQRDEEKLGDELARQRAELRTELVSLQVLTPEPGYIAREATLPTSASRAHGAVIVGTSLVGALVLAAAIAPRRRRSKPAHRHNVSRVFAYLPRRKDNRQ